MNGYPPEVSAESTVPDPAASAPSGPRALDEHSVNVFVSPLAVQCLGGDIQAFGAVAQIDIGGFTRAVEEHSRRGSLALEDVARLIDDCFNVLVTAVKRYGGVVHTFPGDGVIAVWSVPEDGLFDVVDSARGCADEMASSFPTPHRFPLKAGVGAGRLDFVALGAPGSRREALVTGEAMVDASAALRSAGQGEVVLSERARRLARALGKDTPRTRGSEIRPIIKATAAARTGQAPTALLDFVPRLVQDRLRAGLRGWMGEFRNASIVFVELGADTTPSPAMAHAAYVLIQHQISVQGGTIIQFCHDDKGMVCVMGFGVETAHEDDADRALHTASVLRDELAAAGIPASAGVTTGRVFSGLLGGADRLEHRVIGRAVNDAARLMACRRGVLCDDVTRQAARAFDFGAPLPLSDRKGRLDAQQPRVQPVGPAGLPERFRQDRSAARTCGRQQELATMAAWLHAPGAGSGSHPVLLAVLGEAGIGKTQLASDLARRAQVAGYRVIVCQNAEAGPGIALRTFRPALEQLFDLGQLPPDARRRRLTEEIVSVTGSDELAPLLEDVCPLGLADNATTAALTGPSRADNRLALIARLLLAAAHTNAAQGTPLLVALEDAHWMDAASWSLLEVLCASPHPALRFVLTLRVVPGEIVTAAALVNGDRALRVRLGPLREPEIAELVTTRLEARQVTPQLIAAVHRHTEGNPLFCRELLRSLQEHSLLVVEDGTAHLVRGIDDIGGIVPGSVEKILQTRIDRLPPNRQWVLKCASVIGVRFDPALLESMQSGLSLFQLDRDLEALVDADLLVPDRDDGRDTFAFRHTTIRDVAYGNLLHEQRRALHAELAAALEDGPEADMSTLTIFNHWRAAQVAWRALRYVETGGTQALREGDYRPAREFFQFGVATLAGRSPEAGDDRAVRWNQQLGEVLVALGRHGQASTHLEAALRLLGETVPRYRVTIFVLILAELARQLWRRRVVSRHVADANGDAWRQRAEIHEQLGYVYYASCDTLRGAYAALAMLNRAEQAPLAPVCARAYAAMSLTVSVTPLRRLGDSFETAARQAATALSDRAVYGWVEWISSIRAAGEGRWAALLDQTASAIAAGREGAEPRLVVMGSLIRAWGLRLRGDLRAARALAQDALVLARGHGNHLWEAWSLLMEAECDLACEAYEAVITSSQRALDILVEESDRTEEIRASGLLAAALHAQGQETRALRVAEDIARAMRAIDLTSYVMFEGFAGIADLHVTRCERAYGTGLAPSRGAQAQAARSACAELARFARVFPVARPRTLQLTGRLALARGRLKAGHDLLRQALRAAHDLDMPREVTLVRHVLALRGLAAPDEDPAGPDPRGGSA